MISIYYLKGFKQAAQPGVFTHPSPTSMALSFSITVVKAELQHQSRFSSHLIKSYSDQLIKFAKRQWGPLT